MTRYAAAMTPTAAASSVAEITISLPHVAQDAEVLAHVAAPSGRTTTVTAFWDGASTWRARFVPAEAGVWTCRWRTRLADLDIEPTQLRWSESRQRNGIRVSGTHFSRADHDAPVFWLADTAWNIALRGNEQDWLYYLRLRAAQGFNVVQIVTTQWLGAPDGDVDGHLFFVSSNDGMRVNPSAAQRIDRFIELANAHGMVVAPVMLWAAEWGAPVDMAVNPGISLGVDDAVIVARYMLARWGAFDVAWILGGDGMYESSEAANRWIEIGTAVFGDGVGVPVTLHPAGQTWPNARLIEQSWFNFVGYQSGHWGDEASIDWIVKRGHSWNELDPSVPLVNLEPCYEGMRALTTGHVLTDLDVRRATWISLLTAPLAGISYGSQGVWGWDASAQATPGHEVFGPSRPWREALESPGAGQLAHLRRLLDSLEWWTLRPTAKSIISAKPRSGRAYAAQSPETTLVYVEDCQSIELAAGGLPTPTVAAWFDPRIGTLRQAEATLDSQCVRYDAPTSEDWVLLIGARADELLAGGF